MEFFNNLEQVTSEDLKYLSNYHQAQWKKVHGSTSTKVYKGSNVTVSMDMFSLTLFRKSIDKPFVRTEGKNLIMQVNKAYKDSAKTNKETSIRNKFYKVILDNTPVHTKAMLKELQRTTLKTKESGIFLPSLDEAIYIDVAYSYNEYKSYSPRTAQDTYSTDLPVIAESKIELRDREKDRFTAAAAIMVGVYVETHHEPYRELAVKLLQAVRDTKKVVRATEASVILYELAKEQHEQNNKSHT